MRIIVLFSIAVLLNTITTQVSFSQNFAKVTITNTQKKSYNGKDISCRGISDGQITVTAKGGSGNYEYSKDNGATYQSSNVLTGLSGGANCIIRVRDAKDRTNISEATYVWINDVNALTFNTFQRDTWYNSGDDGVSCVYNADGKIFAQVDGGAGGYVFSLDNGATFQSGNTFSNLAAGTYTGMAKDANGCIAYSSSKFSPVILSAPKPIVANIVSQTNISCGSATGSVTVSGSGGKGNYQVSINGGKTFYYLAAYGTYTFSNLSAGNYVVMVKDGNFGTGCYGTADVTISSVNFSASISGNASVCSGSSATFNINISGLTGSGFTAIYKDNNGTNFTVNNLVSGDNTINTSALNNNTSYTLVSVSQAGSKCSASLSGSANITVNAPGTWLGINSNWHDSKNWSCGAVPTVVSDVTIPATANDPVITDVAEVNNLIIANDASLVVTGTLQLGGAITNNGTLDLTDGTLEVVGGTGTSSTPGTAQTLSGSSFLKRTINNLTISNGKGLNLSSTVNDTLNITGFVSFTVGNCTFNTNDNLTLKSTAAGTAAIGDITHGGKLKNNAITGNVIVERYINIGSLPGQHNKSWVMISTPTQGQTIRQSWMEGGDKTSTGYGTQITGSGTGFDLASGTPALKYYNDANNNWTGVTNTNLPVYNPLGYMLFVRGDRSVTFPNFNNTTLRTKGTLITGTTTPINVKAGKFQSIGNPYASDVDIRKINLKNVSKDIIIWDPTLTTGSQYGLGAYQVLYKSGKNYVNLLPSPAYGPSGTINNYIHSGLAFFVQSADEDGQVYFTEKAKAAQAATGIALREQDDSDDIDNTVSLHTSLYGVNSNGSAFITDGVLQQFGSDFSNDINNDDARKLSNTSESISVLSEGTSLVIERRAMPASSDTIAYNMTGLLNQNYRLVFNAAGLENAGVAGYIEDAFTKTRTPLNMNGDTQIDFNVNGTAASKAANRFRVVFDQLRVMPVTFTSVKASAKNSQVAVEWKVENQSNMKQYEVEKSVDGSRFVTAATINANNSASSVYNWIDANPSQGNNYYRIKSVDINGKAGYTTVVKANISSSNSVAQLKVYPNPAINANVTLELNNAAAGIYYARLINPLGQVIVSQKIVHAEGTSSETIRWNAASAKGIYQLEITKPDGQTETIKVVY